jgi:DNA polymerase V
MPILEFFGADARSTMPLSLAFAALSAGFPSAALDFDEIKIDLNRVLIAHPASTFFARVKGDSMRDAGIGDGDLLVIDKGLLPVHGKVAVCFIDGEFTLKRLCIEGGKTLLLPANPAYPPIEIHPGQDFQVWGIITYSIKAH